MKNRILCPTRGGKASYANQDRAIALAKEREAELLFMYVSNVKFLGLTSLPFIVDIETELDEMGEFILTMAQERADKAGVQAEITVERGVFHEVLKAVVQEHKISTVVLGSSKEGTGFTTEEYVQKLGETISREMGVEFIVLRDGEVQKVFKPQGSGSSVA
jgi:nucleotide-binding universal stress UspA family protein